MRLGSNFILETVEMIIGCKLKTLVTSCASVLGGYALSPELNVPGGAGSSATDVSRIKSRDRQEEKLPYKFDGANLKVAH
ncbi:hypothetical protein VTL71DRAFT_14738 [Oculimacula yallundae]|uniref:Uncharacterized protein n=1 Tax=Oculimacula yallundae TaxID=86028 RepID=A0ABR4CLB8_9HELO